MNDRANDDEIIIEEEPIASSTDESDESAAPEDVVFSEDDLSGRVMELEAGLRAEHERLLRTAADLDNLRKRSRREIDEALHRGRADVLREILPVIDSIDSALKNADPDGPASGVLTGVEMVKKQFLSVTAQFGLEQIESKGKPFDPNFHEAVAQIECQDCAPGQVVEEMRTGYALGDRLIRAAMVVVAQGKPSRAPTPPAADEPAARPGPKDETGAEETASSGDVSSLPLKGPPAGPDEEPE